ncbi:M24 family metallopeptidase [Cohnella rhizosphaerae]|uniref:Xaa-Pro peptidase family protein n=1 Tax=Cohnella rhizosphaerae TaxID=1457232 RepID=A0A9X4KUS3_9BACL|nr:Xaa-Pro peptidase family protein [Cohnella rhizosphaerae]MDG0811440.1 Xaa-Pro peptidase family protein [Cohnella rhizosphaerae]
MKMERIARLRELLADRELDGVYIASPENRAYYSGFAGSNGHLLLTARHAVLITDPRYTEQAEQEAPGWRIVTHGLDAMPTLRETLLAMGIVRIGYETNKLSDAEAARLRRDVPEAAWVPLEDYGLAHRAVKDEAEIGLIRRAVQIADRAIAKLVPRLAPGMTEREIQIELEYLMAKEGSEGPAFGTIVASGKRASLPHGSATDKPIRGGEMVVVDFGAICGGYRSDITRTLWVGVPEPDILAIFHLVLRALEAAIAAVRPGMTCGALDRVARDVFAEARMEAFSLRGLGHGVGLHIHELPRVVMGADAIIEPGMVFTVEPGLYVPDVGGVRIEDIVRVTDDGCEVLTRSPRLLQIHEGAGR